MPAECNLNGETKKCLIDHFNNEEANIIQFKTNKKVIDFLDKVSAYVFEHMVGSVLIKNEFYTTKLKVSDP